MMISWKRMTSFFVIALWAMIEVIAAHAAELNSGVETQGSRRRGTPASRFIHPEPQAPPGDRAEVALPVRIGEMIRIPGGTFEMGDHHDLGGREHPSDEVPVHTVFIRSFLLSSTEVTNGQFVKFLNAMMRQGTLRMREGLALGSDSEILCDTAASDPASAFVLKSGEFKVFSARMDHPAVCIRWRGAAAYCNWLSREEGLTPCYDEKTWRCNSSKDGYRLPYEAEWEYGARGGLVGPYYIYPWGDEPDNSRANWPGSGDPYEVGEYPYTTPVGFYDGRLKSKSEFQWPGAVESYQTQNGANGYGLFDTAGNVWEWINDWYQPRYYAESPRENPEGPAVGRAMQDGKIYHVLRGGNWYNGDQGHSRVSNRNVAYYRGPDDPNHRWYHIGFRVARSLSQNNAQIDTPRPTGEAGSRPSQPWLVAHAGELDVDGDGRVSRSEAMEEAARAFQLFDTDRNGQITGDEMAVSRLPKSAMAGFIKGHAKELDSSGDGILNLDELTVSTGLQFDKSDRDRDGLLDLASEPQKPSREGRTLSVSSRPEPRRTPDGDFGTVERQLGLIKNTDRAFPGYTLFAPKHDTMIYLINNAGEVVNSWKSEYEPGQSVYLLENGHLLHCSLTKNQGFIGGGEGGRIEEFDWDGNIVWEFHLSDDQNLMHHDIAPMPNGNILAMVVEKKSLSESLAAGFREESLRDGVLYPDYLVEIEKVGPKSGRIVWEWHVWDHLGENQPGKIDPNGSGGRVKAFWNHFNSIDYNSDLDQILLSVRGNSEIWIVNHGTTTEEARGPKGDLIYRWGNPQTYGRGSERSRMLYQQHDAQWIPEGYPGAGNILIFNNGIGRDYTTVDEIVPPLQADGTYALSSNGQYGPDDVRWTYHDPDKRTFYSQEISGAQRLPNGNTLICAGVHGTFFEVTSQGETVWEYVDPVTTVLLKQGDPVPLDHRGHCMNAVFKIHRYGLDYPAFQGRDLSPRGPLVTPPAKPVSPTTRAMHETANQRPGERGSEERGDRRGGGAPQAGMSDRQGPPEGGRMRRIDSNGNGIVSFEEFSAHEKQRRPDETTDQLRQRFDRLDINRDGGLSEEELEQDSRPRGGEARGRGN